MTQEDIPMMPYEEAVAFFGPDIPTHVVTAAMREGMPKYRYGTLLRLSPSRGVATDFTVTQMFWDWRTEKWYYYIPGSDSIPVYQCESDLKEIK